MDDLAVSLSFRFGGADGVSVEAAKWQAALQAVEDTARGTGNLMPVIVEAVEVNATVGEISDAMRRVYGEYHERVVI